LVVPEARKSVPAVAGAAEYHGTAGFAAKSHLWEEGVDGVLFNLIELVVM
jgi:hypothetical protein